MDILLTGYTSSEGISKIYKNNTITPNTPPSAPTGLTAQIAGNRIKFSWNKATDDSTAQDALTYNIRVGTSRDAIDVKSPQSDLSSGFYRVVESGAIQDTFCIMELPASISACTYIYWSVQAIDHGYMASGFSVTDSILNTLSVDAGLDKSIASGTSTTLNGNASGGSGTYSYSWKPAVLLVNASVQNPTTVNLGASTVFTLTVTDTAGCQGTDSVVITVTFNPLGVSLSTSANTICAGENSQLSALPSGGSGIYAYAWTSNPAGFTSTVQNPVVTPTVTTTYICTLSDDVGTTPASDSITITVHPLPVVDLGSNQSVCKDATVTLDAGAGFTAYNWSTGANTQTIDVDSTGTGIGTTTIFVTVTDANACSASDAVDITFDNCTGMDEFAANLLFNIYPNPTEGKITIDINGAKGNILELCIINIAGQVTFYEKPDNFHTDRYTKQLDFIDYPRGIYFVKLTTEHKTLVRKIVVQ